MCSHGRRHGALLIALFAVSGCDPSDLMHEGVVVSDSAGITIVRHGGDAIRGARELVPVEEVRIGTLDGPEETQFFRLVAAEQVGDEFYTLDYGDSRVRVFSLDGSFRRAFGRDGDGPGEFRSPSLLYVRGDTVVVQGRRLNLLDTQGRSFATGPGRMITEDGYLTRTIPTAEGWMGAWITRKAMTTDRGKPFRETVSLHRVDPLTGDVGELVYTYDLAESRLAGEIGFYLTPFFQANPTHTLGPDGRIYYTAGDAYRIDIISGKDGRLVRRIVGEFTPLPVTDALIADAISVERERVKDAPPGSELAMFAKVVDDRIALPVPETRPVFGLMYVSPSGRLLALRLDLDEDPVRTGNPSTWDLFDSGGRLEGRLTLSGGTRVLQLTDDGLLANVRDELDVQYFVKYRLDIVQPDAANR